MRRALFAALIMLGVALLALTACSTSGNPPANIHVQQNNNNAPSGSATPAPPNNGAPNNVAPNNPLPPGSPGFLATPTLEQSVANEQSHFLAAAPASDYNSPDSAPISVSCQSTGTTTFTCTGSDTDGDVGSADNVNVAADGSSWSDSGMTWTGPDVAAPGGFFVGPVTGWTNS